MTSINSPILQEALAVRIFGVLLIIFNTSLPVDRKDSLIIVLECLQMTGEFVMS